MKISYECSGLIEELKKDIAEFGDIEMYAFFNKKEVKVPFQGQTTEVTILINYDFIDKNMRASEILKILEEQNEII